MKKNLELKQMILDMSGLKPKAYLVLGAGFVREEWKSLCFAEGKSLTQEAIQSQSQFFQTFVPECQGRMLDRQARVELLKQSFNDENLRDALPTLFTHRFRPKFYQALDHALQKGRLLFAHAAEAKVLEERLLERLGYEPRREEFFLLNRLWETLLQSRNFYDEARVLEVAENRVREEAVSFPVSKFYRAEHFIDSPRVQFFWQTLSEKAEVVRLPSSQLSRMRATLEIKRKVAHSLEDSVQFLMDEILTNGDLASHAIVIEDRPEIRRSVGRVALERGIHLLDSRDPTFLITAEEIKTALLPLEIVSRNYPSPEVLIWVGLALENSGKLRKKIIESGSLVGLESYQFLSEVYSSLHELKILYPAKISVLELQAGISQTIQKAKLSPWVNQTFEKVFQAWKISLEQLDLLHKKRPLRILLEELREKLRTISPVAPPERNRFGLKLFRVDQAVSLDLLEAAPAHIHFFGITNSFFDAKDTASEWFSVRDTEVLANEFGLPGRQALSDQAKASFLAWASQAKEMPVVWEYLYDESGSETESIELALNTLTAIQLLPSEELPVHPKVLPSFKSKLAPQIAFTKIDLKRTTFPMSFLNSLGNCAFTAYSQHLLQLYDERDPDFDLSGDSFGNLVHAAVEALVSSNLTLPLDQAFADAWAKTAKPAWIRSERLKGAIRMKTISILESFLVSEKTYREQSHAELIGQELNIELKREGFTFQGRLDRIDQHADGIVLFDYKTNSVLPSGSITREKGKGLQLPAYALALKDQYAQEVVGAQYTQLLPKKTQRNSGFLFARWNKGKKADPVDFPISTATGRSGSLILEDPDRIWNELDQKIGSLIHQAKAGDFTAIPADPKDCERCRYQLLCGISRASSEVVEGDDT